MTSFEGRTYRADGNALTGLIDRLRTRFGDRLALGEAIRTQHGNTTTWIANEPPDAVVYPLGNEEVSETVRACAEARVPIIAFGAGTSLEGHLNAPHGGICIDLSGMNAILEVRPQDLDCTVQAGVTRKQLNAHLRDTGVFFPIDPGADATFGGMAATRASGTNAVRYGTMRENVLNVTAVMADGTLIRTARRARKSSAGFDLTHLLVGSEGTLGIITELTLRLYGRPETIAAAVAPFPTIAAACQAVILAIQTGLPVARIELLDALQVRASNAYSNLDLTEQPTLFLEFHGSPGSVREQVATFEEIAESEGAAGFRWAERPEDRSRLWAARHDALWAAKALRPGTEAVVTDTCVPISNLAACVQETHEDIARTGLIAPIVGHVGDGNFHVLPLIDPANAKEVAAVEGFVDRLVERTLRYDGTCTGEHGVGCGKMKYLSAEHGPALAIMASIKKTLDPLNILNPGKVVAV